MCFCVDAPAAHAFVSVDAFNSRVNGEVRDNTAQHAIPAACDCTSCNVAAHLDLACRTAATCSGVLQAARRKGTTAIDAMLDVAASAVLQPPFLEQVQHWATTLYDPRDSFIRYLRIHLADEEALAHPAVRFLLASAPHDLMGSATWPAIIALVDDQSATGLRKALLMHNPAPLDDSASGSESADGSSSDGSGNGAAVDASRSGSAMQFRPDEGAAAAAASAEACHAEDGDHAESRRDSSPSETACHKYWCRSTDEESSAAHEQNALASLEVDSGSGAQACASASAGAASDGTSFGCVSAKQPGGEEARPGRAHAMRGAWWLHDAI